jgi:hypothetical protein
VASKAFMMSSTVALTGGTVVSDCFRLAISNFLPVRGAACLCSWNLFD